MIPIEYINCKYRNNKFVLKRFNKLNSMELFNVEKTIMNEYYYWPYRKIYRDTNLKKSVRKRFDMVDDIFENPSEYLINYKKFQELYNACVFVQQYILLNIKLNENKKRKEIVEKIFV